MPPTNGFTIKTKHTHQTPKRPSSTETLTWHTFHFEGHVKTVETQICGFVFDSFHSLFPPRPTLGPFVPAALLSPPAGPHRQSPSTPALASFRSHLQRLPSAKLRSNPFTLVLWWNKDFFSRQNRFCFKEFGVLIIIFSCAASVLRASGIYNHLWRKTAISNKEWLYPFFIW